jgi:acetylornithine/succinyldiaminopimelate/putrescine aminotransferase
LLLVSPYTPTITKLLRFGISITGTSILHEMMVSQSAKLRTRSNNMTKLSNAKGQGLLCAFDTPGLEHRKRFGEQCARARVLVVDYGLKSSRFRPHLNINTTEIDHGMNVLPMSMPTCLKHFKESRYGYH